MGPQFFIKRPRFAFVISILITICGLLAAIVMPVDQYPDIAPPKVRVFANYPGASAEVVKETVAGVIEDQVNGAEGMVYMQSKSASDGSYTLTVTFETGADASLAQVDVQNRVALAEPRLPAEVLKRGIKVRKTSSDMLMVVSLFSPDESLDGVFLSNYTSLNVAAEISRIEGVGDSMIIGELNYGMRVWLDPVKLANNDISIQQVFAAIEEQNLQAAVGQLGAAPNPPETQFQYVLKTKGRLVSEEEFGNIILRSDPYGSALRLKDVGRMELGSEVYKGFGEYNNKPGVLLAVYKLSDANSLEVAESVRNKMEELKQFFPQGVDYIIGHDTTLFVKASLEETLLTLLFTVVLVIFVTYLFLGSVRATLVPTIAVPVSIIGTLAALHLLGLTINTVTLFALILAIGLVVDDAIIVVENVERLMHDEDMEARPATQQAMKEVAAPIFATSTVLLAVFGPTLLLPGITGEMFAQFGITLVVAVIISMINALSLSPALCSLLLKKSEHKPNPLIRGFNALFTRTTKGYVRLVAWMASHLLFSSLIIVALFALLGFLFTLVPTSFIPEEDNGYFMIEVQLPPAASLNRTSDYINKLNDALEGDPAIETILAVNGYSVLNSALQPNAGMIIVKLTPWDERKAPHQQQFAMQQKYTAILSQIPGGSVTVFGAPALPGMGAVAGFSYILEDTQSQGEQAMANTLNELIRNMNGLPEVSGAFSTFRADYPQIELNIDRVQAKTLGVAISDIFLTLQTQLGGYYINDFNLYGKTYRVMVQADSEFRQTEADLAKLFVANNKGEMVSMGTLVKTAPIQGADILYRYNTYDSTTVNGRPNEADGYSSGGAMQAIDQLSLNTLPEGFKSDWTGSSYEERKSGNMAPIALGLSLLFTYLFLAALYESMTIPIAIILSVPIAMIGSLLGLLITNEPLSLYGQIGLVLLIGMSAKTAILIVEFAKSQREVDGKSLQEATVEAARLRFRPVCMTALSFLVGVFPLVIASGAGSAARISLGLSIFGGTIAGVIGGTLLVPIFFKLFQTVREKVHGGQTKAPES